MLWHLISSDCPPTVHASVNILAAQQTNGLESRLLCTAEGEGLPWTSWLPLSHRVDPCQWCRFSLYLLRALITPVIRSGCHGNRQCASSIQVGLSCAWATPSILCTGFVLLQPEERLQCLSCVFFWSFGQETLNETLQQLSFCKGDQQAGKCLSPHSERGLAVLLMLIVNRSTSIWYLLETFQNLPKQWFFCSLVPLALWIFNPFTWESAGPLEPMLSLSGF